MLPLLYKPAGHAGTSFRSKRSITAYSQLTEAALQDQGIKPNTICLSIGTEHIDDILSDLQAGFDAVKEA